MSAKGIATSCRDHYTHAAEPGSSLYRAYKLLYGDGWPALCGTDYATDCTAANIGADAAFQMSCDIWKAHVPPAPTPTPTPTPTPAPAPVSGIPWNMVFFLLFVIVVAIAVTANRRISAARPPAVEKTRGFI